MPENKTENNRQPHQKMNLISPELLKAPRSGSICRGFWRMPAFRIKKGRSAAKGRGETILVLEDETVVLNITRVMLERLGYNVIMANSPSEAMESAKAHEGKIDLLLTDIVMPEMNGREFADQLKGLFPDIKVLYMSGYTANVIAHHTVLDEGLHFIEKPFSSHRLAVKVREVLAIYDFPAG